MRQIYWRLYIIRLSLRWCWQINLGDYVRYKGKRCMLIQGVCDPHWDLMDGDERIDGIHKSEFRKVWTPRNIWWSFCHGYRFYMQNWYGIWVDQGIKPWMRACNIWARKRREEKP